MLKLPLFYYPSTITWVDDDPLFINAITQLFSAESEYFIQCFHHPKDCVAFFESYDSPILKTSFLRACTEDERYETADHSPVDLNVPSLYKLLNYAERTKEVSVLVVDYNMPGMNGIDVCQKLCALPMKKILLTGEADDKEAISAFNSNIIDRFLRKDSPTLVDDIQLYIKALSKQYFSESTKPLLSHLEATDRLPLSDPAFINFFNHWCLVHKIREYSIIDKNGSFLAVDKNNKQFYFVLHTNKSLDAFTDLNDDTKNSDLFLDSIKQRERIPFFGIGKESFEFELHKWNNHLFKPDILNGREKYYWAIVEEKCE